MPQGKYSLSESWWFTEVCLTKMTGAHVKKEKFSDQN